MLKYLTFFIILPLPDSLSPDYIAFLCCQVFLIESNVFMSGSYGMMRAREDALFGEKSNIFPYSNECDGLYIRDQGNIHSKDLITHTHTEQEGSASFEDGKRLELI